MWVIFFFFKQKTAYEMRISDWSSDVCSSDLGFRGAPRLYPGNAAGLQLGDDLVGDFLIEARPVVTGTGASGGSGHRGSPRRAPGASLPILNPSRNPVRTLTLRSHENGRASCRDRGGPSVLISVVAVS